MNGEKRLVLTIIISSGIFAFCWIFMIVLWRREYVILRDSIAFLIVKYPTVLTLVSSMISTVLSVITAG